MATLTALKRNLRYAAQSIERLVKDGFLVARDQNAPDGPLLRCRILRTYVRTAYHLQTVTIRDSAGMEQVLRTTGEHRFHVKWKGWTHARDLLPGAVLQEPGLEDSTVLSSAREEHPEGVTVHNLEVEGAHTYFVRAEGTDAEPVWVHNAESYTDFPDQAPSRKVRDAIGRLQGGQDIYVNAVDDARILLRRMAESLGLRPQTSKGMMPVPPEEAGHSNPYWAQPDGTRRGDLINKLDPEGPIHPDLEEGHPHRDDPHYNIRFNDGTKASIIVNPNM